MATGHTFLSLLSICVSQRQLPEKAAADYGRQGCGVVFIQKYFPTCRVRLPAAHHLKQLIMDEATKLIIGLLVLWALSSIMFRIISNRIDSIEEQTKKAGESRD